MCCNDEIITVVLPAYNCETTLYKTIKDIPKDTITNIVLVDDCSTDETFEKAKQYGLKYVYKHEKNMGYGANQKTCYNEALKLNSDIIIMLHPDYQYDPKLIPDLIKAIRSGADVVLASRMSRHKEAIRNGMPIYKYYSNRILTMFQNYMFSKNLSEYHTGYRAYRKSVLIDSQYNSLSNTFVFDNQILISFIRSNKVIKEIYCPAKYSDDSSSIGIVKSILYGMGILYYTLRSKFK